jgi:charged multivesicular body protein 7
VANIEAWRKGLTDATKEGHIPSRGNSPDLLVLNVDEELLRALETKEWGRPLALGSVVHDSVMKEEMMPLRDFLVANESIYRRPWVTLPWNIVSWGFRQLGLAGGQHGGRNSSMGKLVIISNVEEACNEIVRRVSGQTSRTDKIYSKRLFNQEFANILGSKHPMSQADIDILLKYMARDKCVITYNGQTIKFKGHVETKPSVITSEDAIIASLRTLKIDLGAQVDALMQRVETLSQTARDAVARKNRISALAALRSKKLAESYLSRQIATLAQLEDVYSKISQAADQVELVRIMEGSAGVLKALNAEMGGIERVEDVVGRLKEQMTQINEVGDVIAEVGQGRAVIDEDRVDDELEAMEREDQGKREAAERLEKEEREQKEIAETKRKLAGLEAAERQATHNRKNKPTETCWVPDTAVEETTAALKRVSLEEKRTQATA